MDAETEPRKTSNDILAELFSTFHAVPPVIQDTNDDASGKKEHKTKSKKSKKKRKKHKKKKRRSSVSSEASSSDESKPKRPKLSEKDCDVPTLIQPIVIKQEPPETIEENCADDVKKERDKKSEKKKILIPDLRNSTVVQESLKKEAEAKKAEEERRARLEEGEISDGSDSRRHSKGESRNRKRSHGSSRSRNESSHRRDDRPRSSRDETDNHSRDHRPPDRSRVRLYDARHRIERNREEHRTNRHKKSTDSKHRRRSPANFEDRERIDKAKLLEIARKNAKKFISAGLGPTDKIVSKGKSVTELTEYCIKISKREALGEELSDVESGSSDEDKMFHHPFQVKDRVGSIVMNIRNATALPVSKSATERAIEQSKQLTLQFPVSSGNTHRLTENEWVPVEPVPPLPKPKPKPTEPLAIKAPPPPLPVQAPPFVSCHPPVMPVPPTVAAPVPYAAIPPPPRPIVPIIQPTVIENTNSNNGMDINDIVTKRLDALRKLQENPRDRMAKHLMSRTQTQVDRWIREKRAPEPRVETGEFRGSTGARILSAAELGSGLQAWAKRDQLISAQPVQSRMGMALLQKMGWQPGEGLGKNKEGTLEPLKLEVKTDKKGLVAMDENWKGKTVGLALPTVKTLDGKHPVSLLNEYCTRRRWGQPAFELAFECGPDHKKTFLFKVKVNNVEYQPTVASVNKKQAKAEAAAIALRALGLISGPTEAEIAAGTVSKL